MSLPRRAVFLGLVLLAPAAHAERPITYEEALRAAVQSNPTLGAQTAGVKAAKGSLLASRGMFDVTWVGDATGRRSTSKGFFQGFPFDSRQRFWDFGSGVRGTTSTGTSYNVDFGVNRNNSTFITEFIPDTEAEVLQDAFTANVDVSVTQNLLRGHRLAYNLRNVTAAREGWERAQLQEEKTRQDILAQTASAYWNWVYQSRLVANAKKSVDSAEENLRVGQLRVEQRGDLAPVEVTRLQAAVVQAKTNLLDLELAERQAADTLLLLVGETPGQDVLPATKPGEVGTIEFEAAAQIQVALAQNLDIQLARADVGSQARQHRDARHAMLPELSATVGAGLGSQSQRDADNDAKFGEAVGGLFGDDAFPYVSLSGNISVPLGNRAARGEQQRTAAGVSQAELSLAQTERQVQADVASQVARLQTAKQRVQLADANVRLARQTLDAEEAKADKGRAILKDVLEARNEMERTEAEAIKARTDYRVALVELQKLLGGLEVP